VNITPPLPPDALRHLLLQLAVLLVVSRRLGELVQRLGQPPVIGELLAGIALGPSLFGWLWPAAYFELFPATPLQAHLLEIVAWMGMILLLLLTGLETDVRLLRHLGRAALLTALFGLLVPFTTGLAFGEWAVPAHYLRGPRHLFAAFFATSIAVCAMPVIAKILLDLELSRRNVGIIILSAGVVIDAVGWVILSVLAGIADTDTFHSAHLIKTLALTLGFVATARWLGYPTVSRLLHMADDRSQTPGSQLTLIIVLTFLGAALTDWIGIHAMFGAFVTGCVVRQAPRLRAATLERLEALTMSVFAPIFFCLVGLKVDLRQLESPALFLGAIGVATASMLLGGALGGLSGRLSLWEALAVGAGLNARGAMGLVVALLGLQLRVLHEEMFSIIVTVAVVTSLMAPLALRTLMSRVPVTPEEAARLAGGTPVGLFDTRLLKVLLATAGGPNALFGARLAAALVRGEGAALSVLFVDRRRPGGWTWWNRWARLRHLGRPDLAGQNLSAHLAEIRTTTESQGVRMDLRHEVDLPLGQVLRREAARGVGLVMVGASLGARQRLRAEIHMHLLEQAPAHVAIVNAAETYRPLRRLLVPTDGSYFGRAAVELTVLLAERFSAEITILYVVQASPLQSAGGDTTLDDDRRRALESTLRASLRPILGRTAIRVTLIVREDAQLHRPVLRELQEESYDLLVVGVEAEAMRHRLAVGYDVELLVDEAPCASLVLVPRLPGRG
jgi:Kef-type K+ transport system membrane component KefB/nucleotide-binding universal stress UspA family protein